MRGIGELRSALTGGGPVLGVWAAIPSTLTAEAAAAAGADYVVVDQQHGAVGPGELMAMLQAIKAGGAAPLVRVARLDPWIIGSALDLGALGVIVPMVDSAEQAARAVAACRYAPLGERSFGPLRADLSLGSARPAELGDGPLCLVMAETRTAVEAIDDIAGTPGLDGIYIGPSDLALSLGLQPTLEIEHPPVREAVARIRTACEAAKVIAGVHCLTGQDAARHAADGFAMVTAGADLIHLRGALAQALSAARGA